MSIGKAAPKVRAIADQTFSAGDLVRQLEINIGWLRYLEAHGVISPQRDARMRRRYSLADRDLVRLSVPLRRGGLSAKCVVRLLQSHNDERRAKAQCVLMRKIIALLSQRPRSQFAVSAARGALAALDEVDAYRTGGTVSAPEIPAQGDCTRSTAHTRPVPTSCGRCLL